MKSRLNDSQIYYYFFVTHTHTAQRTFRRGVLFMIKYSYATIVYISIHDHETLIKRRMIKTMRSKKSQRTSSAFDAFLSYVTISYAFVWQQQRILSSQNKGSNWNGNKSECCCARCQNFSFSRNCFFLHRTYIVLFALEYWNVVE